MFFMNKFKGLLVLFLLIFSTFSFNLKEASADMLWQKVKPAGFSEDYAYSTSIVVDGNNKLYVAFIDGANEDKATVMTYNGASWEVVGSSGFSASWVSEISLIADKNNKLYVSFVDSLNDDKVTVMTYNGTDWEVVGQAGVSVGRASFPSLAVDGNNKLYVAFSDYINASGSTVMTYNGTDWEAVGRAGFSEFPVNEISLAIDGNNKLYIAFDDSQNTGQISVMTYNGTDWEVVGQSGFSIGIVYPFSLSIDENNKLYLAFLDEDDDYKANVVTYNGTDWEVVGQAGLPESEVYEISLVIDGNNKLYVAFLDEDNEGKATVMTYNGTSWDYVGRPGLSDSYADYTVLAIDGNNKLYVVFSDGANDDKATVMSYNDFNDPNLPVFAGGTGTESDPYQISTCQQLEDLNYTPDDGDTYPLLSTGNYYILKNDIDCSDTVNWNNGEGFVPIRDFFGYFDGNNKIISGLYINLPESSDVGLFSKINIFSRIKDLGLVNIDITGSYSVGGLVGSNSGIIENVYTTGKVEGGTDVGGLIGATYNSTEALIGSYSSADVLGVNGVGGLIGDNNNSRIENSYSTGNVNGNTNVGGLIGDNFCSHIENSYSTGNVNGNTHVGGLIGNNVGKDYYILATVVNSYSVGSVSGNSYVGGLIGFNSGDRVYNSFSVSNVSGVSHIGGFIGLLKYFPNLSLDEVIVNSGWYKAENNSGLKSIEIINDGEGADTTYVETDNTVFYSKSHSIYTEGSEYTWDFSTPIWYEQLNDYPKFTAYIPDTSSPVVSNITANSITKTSATLNGEVTDNGGEEITEVGFEYGLTSAYATSTVESTDYASSTFSYDLTDLSCNTTYSYRAYATNTKGTSYSSSGTFTTDDCERSHSRVIGSVSRVIATLPVKEEVKPISTVTILNIKRILKQNIIGSDIKELQVWLNNHGYIISLIGPGSKGYETTKFGSLTKKAVMSFQKANGLTPDGVVGPLTLKKMNEIK